MNISNSNDKFVPTSDWLKEKYDELNIWLFGGELGACDFSVFTKGKGSQGRTLGRFSLQGKGLKVRTSDRRMIYYVGTKVFIVTEDNFVEIAKPLISVNGNYKRTELSWLSTLVHEMCHYYTYRKGRVPVQAHGSEFRNIAAYVSYKSNGVFDVKRFAQEDGSELDAEMAEKQKKREESKKSKLTALLVFKKTGKIELITTSSETLIDSIINQNTNKNCIKIIKSNSPEFIEFLWKNGYKHNMKTYRYWSVRSDVVDEINKYPNTVVEMLNVNEMINLTTEDIKLMVEMTLEKLIGEKEDNFVDISPNMNLSDETPLE